MGYREVKQKVIAALSSGVYNHEPRKDINRKNLLHTGAVGPSQVIDMVKACPGTRYKKSPHHMDRSIDVHVMKPDGIYQGWYVKFYFLPGGTTFISVYPDTGEE